MPKLAFQTRKQVKQVRLFGRKTWVQARFATNERGTAMVEYVVLMALVAVLGIPAVNFVGTNISNRFDQVAEQLAPEEQPLDDGSQCDQSDHGNQGDHGNNDGDQNDGNHDDGNQGHHNDGDHGNQGGQDG